MKRLLVLVSLTAALAFAFLQAPQAQADRGFQHIVREGETLASIAERYYGDPRRETVLVAENGLTAQGGAPIVVGLRLQVPYVHFHRVEEGETWAQLARRFYGDVRRAFVLVEANRGDSQEQPPVGAELLVPYPLRHVAGQNENVSRIAKNYFGSGIDHVRRLRRFNGFRNNRLTRGQAVLIPLSDLLLSEEGRNIIAEETGDAPNAGEVRELQAQIERELPDLVEHVRRGRYTEAVALGNRLLGARMLTGNQIVTIQRHLGTSFVALGRHDLAIQAFRAALDRQHDLTLDTVRTSPTVMRAFQRAREIRDAREAPAEETDAPEEGEEPASED